MRFLHFGWANSRRLSDIRIDSSVKRLCMPTLAAVTQPDSLSTPELGNVFFLRTLRRLWMQSLLPSA